MAYRACDQIAGEDVPNIVEEGGQDGSDLVIGGKTHSHHAVVAEVGVKEEHKVNVPEELLGSPLQPKRRICDQRKCDGLYEEIW